MSEELSPKEQLLAAHRKEKKDLQGKIRSLKKSVPKEHKARVKEMRKTCEEMEQELKLRHEKELQDLIEKTESVATGNDLEAKVQDLNLEDATEEKRPSKVNRAQKKRERRAAKAKQLVTNAAEAEANYHNSARFLEEKQMKENLTEIGLMVKSVPSDGNCMYSAIQDQLDPSFHGSLSLEELRQKTASYIAEHKQDFIPFLTNRDTGDMFTEEEFDEYCGEIEKPSTWGGQVELLALCRILKSPIHVIQATAPVTVHGEEFDSKPIILTYHRHELGLGEHYNSVTKFIDNSNDS